MHDLMLGQSPSFSQLLPFKDPSTRTYLANAIKQKSIVYASDTQRIISPHGQSQTWLIDMRPLLLDSKSLDLIADAFWDAFAAKMPFQLGGMEVAAIPLLCALLLKAEQRELSVNGFIVRKSRKTYGLARNIEGVVTDVPVIVVDDSINSGASLEKVRSVLQQNQTTIAEIFTVMDFRSQAGIAWRCEQKLHVTSLFTIKDFDLKMKDTRPPRLVRSYRPLWEFYAFGGAANHLNPKSTPLLHDGRLYMGSDRGIMYCLDAANGRLVWEYQCRNTPPLKGIWSSPALHNHKLYFGAYNGTVYCLDAATGQPVWQNAACEWVGSTPLILPHHHLVIIGLEYERPGNKGSMAAFDLSSGERRWEVWYSEYQHGSGSYYAPDDTVIVPTSDHTVVAYQAATGEQRWVFYLGRSAKYPPAIDHETGLVVVPSYDGGIYMLDAHTGELRGHVQTDNITYTTPLITHGKIFCGSGDRHLYVIDLYTRQLIKKIIFNGKVYGAPRLIAPDSVIVGCASGIFREYDANTLELLGWYQAPDAITNAIAVSPDGKIIYVPTYMNEIYAYERFQFDENGKLIG